ncbi:hypothetical protein AB0D13_35180 [Streptomyces sp. NPDC048430]|uniref:hypothetical protein n=1 Tax=Streptomyces sp. NPDC048430 TaxID=3155388 RepID=UPI0034290AC9
MAEVDTRWRGSFGYLTAIVEKEGEDVRIPLCRIEYLGDGAAVLRRLERGNLAGALFQFLDSWDATVGGKGLEHGLQVLVSAGGRDGHVLVKEGSPGLAGGFDMAHTELSLGNQARAVQAPLPLQRGASSV